MTDDSQGPELPPGIRLHLEAGEKRLHELAIDGALEEMFRSNEAYFHIREVLATTLLVPHRKDGWLARRKLRKELAGDFHGPGRHLAQCKKCRAWVDELLKQAENLIAKPPSV